MLQENVLSIIDKLVSSKVSFSELQQIASLVNDPDFKDSFQLVEDLEDAIKPIGRSKLKQEIKIASEEYHNEMRVVEVKNKSQWKLSLVAACFLAIVSVSTFFIVHDHSNKDIYHSRSGGATLAKN